MTHDAKLALKRAYLRGYEDAMKAMASVGGERLEKGWSRFIAHEEFPMIPESAAESQDAELVARSLPGRLRIAE